MKTDFKLAIGICSLLFAFGCGNTADGVQKDAQIDSQKMSESAKDSMDSASKSSKDAGASAKKSMANIGAATMLTPRLKTAITADKDLNDPKNSIDVDSTTDEVTLSGYVSTAALKTRAEEVVKKEMSIAKATQKLTNKLEVKS